METHPPGWLPDPFGRYQFRYWNGSEWTDTVSTNGSQETDPHGVVPSAPPLFPPVVPAAAPVGPRLRPRWTTQVWGLVVGGAALVVLGAFLPWVKAQAGIFSVTKNGIDGDGVLTLLLAVAIGIVFVAGRSAKTVGWIVIALAGLILAIALYDIIDISNQADELTRSSLVSVSAEVGAGLWLTLGAGVAALVGGILALNSGSQR